MKERKKERKKERVGRLEVLPLTLVENEQENIFFFVEGQSERNSEQNLTNYF
jgi:hypothetical protein